jgi:predicted nucleic acid-binding protein
MSGRCFLDTNIFIYSFDQANPDKAAIAKKLIQDRLRSRSGLISFQVIQEFFSVALKRMPAFVSSPDAELYLLSVLRPLLGVNSSIGLYSEGLRLQWRYKLSWYDSLIVAAANEAGCELLYSEDLRDGARFERIVVKNPFR